MGRPIRSAGERLRAKKRALFMGPAYREAAFFLGRWIRAPHRIAAVAPASRHLARAMAREIDPGTSGVVVELGGGTGAITRALLATGLPPSQLIIVERDLEMCRVLRDRFPEVRVVRGDARELSALMRRNGVEQAVSVVSSLPLLSMTGQLRRAIVEEVFALLGRQGTMVQYTYGLRSPVQRETHGLTGELRARVWRNIPPATVWRYSRK